jgi:ribosome biogenesis GTPase / thiamine phosphate phosphatase
MMHKSFISGWVVRLQSSFYTVQATPLVDTVEPSSTMDTPSSTMDTPSSTMDTPTGTMGALFTCSLRGRLKQGKRDEDLVAVGDRVQISLLPDGKGVIEVIEERRSALSRQAPMSRGERHDEYHRDEYRQILLANPDQVVIVFACADPAPHLRMLDRFLVVSEKQKIPAIIVVNKVDLMGIEQAQAHFSVYPSLGYPVIYTSVISGMGIAELRGHLYGKLSALAGPSGVGKTSLLNTIQPDLGLMVRHVSHATTKGRHTTVVRQMFTLSEGGFVADMPGLRSLALWDTQAEELDGYFPEMRELVRQCPFNDCTHRTEADCAIRKAVETGSIHPERYQSYLNMRFNEE